jgi:Fe-S-cluster-containing dehydrogenase component
MNERLIYFDGKKCIGCHSCEVGCQLENDAPPGVRLRLVKSHAKGHLPDTRLLSVSTACFHCNDPSCVSACPAGALRRRDDGVVEHIRSRCIGCAYCIQACPFSVPKASPGQRTMRKCSFCVHRIDHGKKPACVAKCPSGALTYSSEFRVPSSESGESQSRSLMTGQKLEKGMKGDGLGFATRNPGYPPGAATVYGLNEHLHMVYALEDRPGEYSMPDPVPLNTVRTGQPWKWLAGLVPGVLIMAWLWKRLAPQEREDG